MALASTPSRRSFRTNAKRVLVIDADAGHLELLKTALRDRGYDVEVPGAGEHALALVRQQRMSAVVSEVVMPALDGYDLCLALRDDAALSELPVVLFSWCQNGESADLAELVGADAFLTRGPDDIEKIVAALSGVLPATRASRAPASRPLRG